MLKIKDNVDLKKLEKFGFGYREDTGKWSWNYSLFEYIFICSWNRKIEMESLCGKAGSVLIDLYEANLVEKVEG